MQQQLSYFKSEPEKQTNLQELLFLAEINQNDEGKKSRGKRFVFNCGVPVGHGE